MERFLIKREPYLSQEIEEVVNIDNHSLIDKKPNNIKLEYIDNNTSSTPICSGNHFEIKQELNCSYEGYSIHEVKNDDLEETVNHDNHPLIDKKSNNIKLENIDQNRCSIPIYSGKYSEIKRELDCSYEDYPMHYVDNACSDRTLSKLRNATIVLERLSIVEILKYTKKPETESKYTGLNVDAMKYVCVHFCSKCDGTVDAKSIRHNIIKRPECGCMPTLAYQCMRCNKHFATYKTIQRHVNTKGLCKSRNKFLRMDGFNDNEWEKLNCPKCNVSLEDIVQFTKHVNGCEEVPKFWCSLCDYGSRWIYNFRVHSKFHASQSTKSESACPSAGELMQNDYHRKEKRFHLKTSICYCSTCNEMLVENRFKILSSSCNKCGTPYTYRCPKCNKEYKLHNDASHHFKSICSTSKHYRCSVCKVKEFTTYDALKRHMSHCGKTHYIYCKFCSFTTKHKRAFHRHLKRHFESDLSFIDQARDEGPLYELFCEQCNESKENGEYKNDCYRYYCLKCKNKLLLQCRKCNLVYKSRRGIMAHITSDCGSKIESKLQKCPK